MRENAGPIEEIVEEYDDVPTTPMSDVSEFVPENEDVRRTGSLTTFLRKPSSSSISNISNDHPKFSDEALGRISRHLQGSKQTLHELKISKERFELIQNHVMKIRQGIDSNTHPDASVEIKAEETAAANEDSRKPRDRLTQRIILTETKLSSQLIRLESLIRASVEDQGELITQLEEYKLARDVKDRRYNSMLATVCKIRDEMVDELLVQCADN
jgi:hypothetical protein